MFSLVLWLVRRQSVHRTGKNPISTTMSSLALPYRKSPILQAIRAAEPAAEFALVGIVWIGKRLPWLVALIPLIIFGFLYTVIAYYPLKFLRQANSKATDYILNAINQMDERELMELHLEIENSSKRLARITSMTRPFFVFKPLIAEFKLMLHDEQRLERGLFVHLYPDYEQPLSKEQEQELIESFAPWRAA